MIALTRTAVVEGKKQMVLVIVEVKLAILTKEI